MEWIIVAGYGKQLSTPEVAWCAYRCHSAEEVGTNVQLSTVGKSANHCPMCHGMCHESTVHCREIAMSDLRLCVTSSS